MIYIAMRDDEDGTRTICPCSDLGLAKSWCEKDYVKQLLLSDNPEDGTDRPLEWRGGGFIGLGQAVLSSDTEIEGVTYLIWATEVDSGKEL